MSEKLFVYGTLGPKRPNAHVLENIGGTFCVAYVTGRLKAEGWGAELGFPGMVPDENGERIDGFVFTSDTLADNWQVLDDFEGAGYRRVETTAVLSDGSRETVWVYALV
ncbi:gamma-glutamylcyclotransferase (GGCT)/AIG2-like uncharacterized protein YtfP [Neisseria sp. HSC-16F19]|nr:gamma-glutamylcyclotransferase family protein [Neisseria sp. HSC-16F19]MCP2041916.1 gamma-glutamylcyclotransferase (GGCT)/AIG2-like uncharacterized protein YtfP [Neisseria sp. HSC-16F19]